MKYFLKNGDEITQAFDSFEDMESWANVFCKTFYGDDGSLHPFLINDTDIIWKTMDDKERFLKRKYENQNQ